MLGRRELSEAQVRQRLARREHAIDAIQTAIERLIEERSIDDVRVAEAIARSETSIRKRGKLRVRRTIQSAGVAGDTARRVLNEVFAGLDADPPLAAAMAPRPCRSADIAA